MPLVAIVGRPNVGKSTLFNRLTEERDAIVHDEPGVTRDRVYGEVEWGGRTFEIVDTGGFVPASADVFEEGIREQVMLTLDEADAFLFVVDTHTGPTDLDSAVADLFRKKVKKPVFLVANKSDNAANRLDSSVFYGLGLGEVYPISSVNGIGTGDMLDALLEVLPEDEEEEDDGIPRFAFVGRPNVGKSSLANALLGHTRSIVTDIAGTTRDAVDAKMEHEGRELIIVDTAGLRKKARVTENVEFYSTLRTERALQRCDVAVLLIDAERGLEAQDAKVLRDAERMKKGLVIVVNKWDLVEGKETNTARDFERAMFERLGLLDYVPVLFVSALTGQRKEKVLDLALKVYDERQKRVDTAQLNEVLEEAVRRQHPPSFRGTYVKIKYATQVRAEPPVIALFCNHPLGIKENYRRYLVNRFREAFGFEGVPLTLSFKQK
jgi:GTP-binding protein